MNSEQLRSPSETHNNADLLIWAMYLLEGNEKWIDVEDLYLKAFELAPARLSWRTKTDIPDYKKCAKALQEIEDPSKRWHLNVFAKDGSYKRRLTRDGYQWCRDNQDLLKGLYQGDIVPSAKGQDDERKIRSLTRSEAYQEWLSTGDANLNIWSLAEAFRCTPETSWTTWQTRLEEHFRAAERNGKSDLLTFIEAATALVQEERRIE